MTMAKKDPIPVLIVEDELLIRMEAVHGIGEEGYLVYEAGNADEAIQVLERHEEIRLIFTDVNMPGSMNGLQLAHYVWSRWPPVKIIVTSGLTKVQQEDLPPGALFVGKPYHPIHVAGRLRELLTAA